jgi:hypothetical protein
MRERLKLILPLIGLIVFGGVTYYSVERRQYEKAHGQYFWWASIPLDTRQPKFDANVPTPCKAEESDCVTWDPVILHRSPGLMAAMLMITAFPAFVIGMPIVRSLGRLGINEMVTFMILMPVLIAGWYYGLAWLDERWISKRSRRVTKAGDGGERPATSD